MQLCHVLHAVVQHFVQVHWLTLGWPRGVCFGFQFHMVLFEGQDLLDELGVVAALVFQSWNIFVTVDRPK